MGVVSIFTRRAFVAAAAQALSGCADTPVEAADAAAAAAGAARASEAGGLGAPRVLMGGFLAPPLLTAPSVMPAPGRVTPLRPGTGAFVKLFSPTALAVRGAVMLVADPAAGRLWRVDLGFNTLSGVAGAPSGTMPGAVPGLGLALGPDESAWVLEAGSAQVLRFARDGRLLQTFKVPAQSSSFALADGGATLLTVEPTPALWSEQRLVGGMAVAVRPQDGERNDARVGTVDAIAVGGPHVLLLDRARGVVHRAQRDGRVLQSLGAGLLKQPQGLAVDRFERAWVIDGLAGVLHVLWPDGRTRTLEASALRLQQIGGLAVDERTLALSDRLSGQVLLHPLPGAAW